LGYAPDKTDALVTKPQKRFYQRDLQKAGFMTQGGTDFFRHRVMFPIFNVSGKVIAFAGRQIQTEKRSPKYINSPKPISTSNAKWSMASRRLRKPYAMRTIVFLSRRLHDVISFHQAGIENVVASSGTALTPDQIRFIRRYAGRITVSTTAILQA
jgi:DNA primase